MENLKGLESQYVKKVHDLENDMPMNIKTKSPINFTMEDLEKDAEDDSNNDPDYLP